MCIAFYCAFFKCNIKRNKEESINPGGANLEKERGSNIKANDKNQREFSKPNSNLFPFDYCLNHVCHQGGDC